jgi:hypothetical protein
MATLAPGGRISTQIVEEEIKRLMASWDAPGESPPPPDLQELLDDRQLEELDLFDRVQLAFVVDVCRRSRSLSGAGRTLFGASRTRKTFSTMLIDFANIWHVSESSFHESTQMPSPSKPLLNRACSGRLEKALSHPVCTQVLTAAFTLEGLLDKRFRLSYFAVQS